MRQIQFVHALKRSQVTSKLIVASEMEWATLPEATSLLWSAHIVDGTVYALALDSEPARGVLSNALVPHAGRAD